jgi:SAM-dependent methyltransferase
MRYLYLLGDSRREAARLRRQARLWDPVALALFDRLGIRRGLELLEIGPGEGSLHMELRRRVRRPVDAVERSPVFCRKLRRLQSRDGLGPGRIWEMDLAEAALPARRYDLVFARWVFLFLPDPEGHLRKLARALKPGGRIALQDYHRETWALVPRPAEWWDFLAADRAFFATQGADVNVGGRLPDLYRKVGLEVVETVPTVKLGHPGSAVWNWLTSYFLSVAERYARCPPLTRAKVERLRRHWVAAQRRRTSLLIAPAVLDVVGRKR